MRDWGGGGGGRITDHYMLLCQGACRALLLRDSLFCLFGFSVYFKFYSLISVMLKAVLFYYAGTYSHLFPSLFYSICRLLSDSVLLWCVVMPYSRDPQIPCTMLPGRLNLLR